MKNRIFVGAESGRPIEIAVYPDKSRVEYLTSNVENQDMDAPEISDNNQPTPEEQYRKYDEAAMANPTNPYNAALNWIGSNAALAGSAISAAVAPIPTFMGFGGNALGQYVGNKSSDKLFDNPDKDISLNYDMSITPRQLMQHGFGLLGGFSGNKLGKYGMQEIELPTGAETSRVYTRRWSPWIIKETSISPKEMAIRGQVPGTLKSKFLYKTLDGNYVYKQIKAIPTDTALDGVYKRIMNSGLYEQEIIPDGDIIFKSPIRNEWVTDLKGNVGKTLFGKDVIFDPMSLTPEEGIMALYKNGNKIRKYGQ